MLSTALTHDAIGGRGGGGGGARGVSAKPNIIQEHLLSHIHIAL